MPRLVRRRTPFNRRHSLVDALAVVRGYHQSLWWAGAMLAVGSSVALMAFAVVTLLQTQAQSGLPPLPPDSPFTKSSAGGGATFDISIDGR